MKKTFFLILLTIGCLSGGFPQGKIWRTIDLRKFPNNAFTSRFSDFRELLVQGVLAHKIMAYKRTGTFADFSVPFSAKELKATLQRYEMCIEDHIPLRYDDFHTLELHEYYSPLTHKTYTIKTLALMTMSKETQYLTVVFKYDEAKKYLTEIYQTAKQRSRLAACWQSPISNAQQTPVTEALETRKFTSVITETQLLPPKHLKQLQQASVYAPIPPGGLSFFHPNFIRTNKHTLRTQICYRINLKKKANLTLYQPKSSIVAEIIQGVKAGKIQPYEFTTDWGNPKLQKMPKNDCFRLLAYMPHNTCCEYDTIAPAQVYLAEITGWWETNTLTRKIKFIPTRLALYLPKNTRSEYLLRWAQFDFTEVKAYCNARNKKHLTKIFDKQMFTGKLTWFMNRNDDNLQTLWYKYVTIYKTDFDPDLSLSDARLYVQEYLDSFGKK